jgi:GTP diphosphokinase / guanosine-3',5'-bis(diphosphate) 3'-diphosphatase
VPGKFRDYVAIPKVNGYQSLHTTLIGPFGTNIEFQLRTHAMDVVAESGVAAHWLYKASEPNSDTSQRLGTQWLQSLLDIQQETHDASEFWDHIKIDLFPDAVYVFTPKSKILALPRGATVMDFAYAIHSGVGNRACGAIINGEQRRCAPSSTTATWWRSSPATRRSPTRPGCPSSRPGARAPRSATTSRRGAGKSPWNWASACWSQALRSEGIATLPRRTGDTTGHLGKAAALHRQQAPATNCWPTSAWASASPAWWARSWRCCWPKPASSPTRC